MQFVFNQSYDEAYAVDKILYILVDGCDIRAELMEGASVLSVTLGTYDTCKEAKAAFTGLSMRLARLNDRIITPSAGYARKHVEMLEGVQCEISNEMPLKLEQSKASENRYRINYHVKEHLQGLIIGFLTGGAVIFILHLLNVIG